MTDHQRTGERAVDVQGIAAIAWRCIRECKDYEGPPVMCPAHQEEAKALIGSGASASQEPLGSHERTGEQTVKKDDSFDFGLARVDTQENRDFWRFVWETSRDIKLPAWANTADRSECIARCDRLIAKLDAYEQALAGTSMLVGFHGTPASTQSSGSAQSAAPESSSPMAPRTALRVEQEEAPSMEKQIMNKQIGTTEPWLTLNGNNYTREHAFAIYVKAEGGEPLTPEEARVVGGWLVHPLNTTVELAPYAIGAFLMRRQEHDAGGATQSASPS